MSSLQEHLENAYDVDVEEQIELHEGEVMEKALRQRFIVDDEDKAQWALRKLARIRAQRLANIEQRERETERIDSWFETVSGPLNRQADFFLGLLREYHETELAKDPKKKSIKLPAGTLKSIAGQNKWTVDAAVFLEWFDNDPKIEQEHPDLVRVKREAALSTIKEILEPKDDRAVYRATGEFVPGVTVEPGQRSFRVEVAE